MKKLPLIAMLMTACLALPVMALDLHGARANGSIGEKNDGYVAALRPSAEVNAIVAEVNAKRSAEYARISKENGQPVNVVAKLAAGQIVGGLPAGASYQDGGGNWKSK